MKDAIIFTAGMTAIFLGVILGELHAQTSRLTSDPMRAIHGLPIPPGIFVPPSRLRQMIGDPPHQSRPWGFKGTMKLPDDHPDNPNRK